MSVFIVVVTFTLDVRTHDLWYIGSVVPVDFLFVVDAAIVETHMIEQKAWMTMLHTFHLRDIRRAPTRGVVITYAFG